jgi:hypothetical protein
MRTIDADKLVDMLYDNEFAALCPLDEVSGVVDACPTVDAVPVVRCKDCKHRIYKDMGEEIGEIGGCGLFNCAMPNEGFCSHGERKDGADG